MSTTLTAKQRSQFLKQLRDEHRATVENVQARLKEQKDTRRKITEALGDEAKTVPEIAAASGLPADQVLWHLIALKKYNLVIETGQSDEYYVYQQVKEVKA
ncbi:MAG TPA: winged helix-turn-helix domain-containing protein [Anaerolineae bacterium]|nr:winged helix-turn-helix domain-containing protein [Anaerolineae bacterium]